MYRDGDGAHQGAQGAGDAGHQGATDLTGAQMENSGAAAFKRNRTEGYVIECDGAQATISSIGGVNSEASNDYWAVGQLISIQVGENRVIGLLYKVDLPSAQWELTGDNVVHIHVELVGEVRPAGPDKLEFSTGISQYPYMGAVAHRIRFADLTAIYENSDSKAITVGVLSQNNEIPAKVSVDSMVSRHFAVVGTTGVGKSTAVTLLLRKICEARPDLRVLILDPHNEFACAFPDLAITITSDDLDLPFWLFKLEELVDVFFRGRRPVPEEVDMLRDLIPLAMSMYKGSDDRGLRKSNPNETSFTADMPMPWRIADLIAMIDERMGLLETREERPFLKALRNRIEAAINDPRFKFMFQTRQMGDAIADTIARIYRVPQNGRPITAFQLSGVPSEVVNSVASVLCRIAFDLAVFSDSKIQTLVVCEEAHRYIPADPNAGFEPTRAAIARIAKEGRKYGVYLGIVTQRPGELDPTILSQCNTFFSMRLGNDRDQEIMRKAISGSSQSTIAFLSSLANREAIAFGQGVNTPMRLKFEKVPADKLPGNSLYEQHADLRGGNARIDLEDVIRGMRNQKNKLAAVDDYVVGKSMIPRPGAVVGEQRPSQARIAPSDQATAPNQAGGRFEQSQALRRHAELQASVNPQRRAEMAAPPMTPSAPPPALTTTRAPAPASAPAETSGSARDLIRRFRS